MESRKQDDAREDLERHIMSRERVWQFEIEHREEEWMLFSRLYHRDYCAILLGCDE
jgi:hypothetical protein